MKPRVPKLDVWEMLKLCHLTGSLGTKCGPRVDEMWTDLQILTRYGEEYMCVRL